MAAAITGDMVKCVQCPLTLEAFVDPVVISTGHVFERTALDAWIQVSGRKCPCTGLPFSEHVYPCYALKSLAAQLATTMEQPWTLDPWRLELGELLSRAGNQAEVYRGVLKEKDNGRFDRTVAVKVFRDGPQGAMAAFEKEVRVLHRASRQCEGVVQLLGGCKKGDDYCLVMKMYSKNVHSLAAEKYGGRVPLPVLCRYMATVARALQSLHDQDIVSQDVKPENILYDDFSDSVVIADFGVAKIAAGTIGVKNTVDGVGTPNYMAPEQWDSECTVSSKADIWALACTIIALSSGEVPWSGLTLMQMSTKVVVKKDTPPLPAAVPEPLRPLLRRCLSHDAAARPSAAEVLHDLLDIAAAESACPPHQPPSSPSQKQPSDPQQASVSVLKAELEEHRQLLSSLAAERDNAIAQLNQALQEVEAMKNVGPAPARTAATRGEVGPPTPEDREKGLHKLAEEGDLQGVRRMVEKGGADVNARDNRNWTLQYPI